MCAKNVFLVCGNCFNKRCSFSYVPLSPADFTLYQSDALVTVRDQLLLITLLSIQDGEQQLKVRMLTTCLSNFHEGSEMLWAFNLWLTVCVNYWRHVITDGSFFLREIGLFSFCTLMVFSWEKSGYLVRQKYGIFSWSVFWGIYNVLLLIMLHHGVRVQKPPGDKFSPLGKIFYS